jgi:hypothetical protein
MVLGSKLYSNPALDYLLADYSKYHWVMAILGTISLAALYLIVRKYWKLCRIHGKSISGLASLFIATFSSFLFSLMSFIVFGNFLNAIKPERGFTEAINSWQSNATSSSSIKLFRSYSSWVESGDSKIPQDIENIVHERLSWQLPKAITCSVLFALTLIATYRLWSYLISTSSIHSNTKQIALFILGVSLSFISALFWIMAIANTQASIAPFTLSLLFS